MPSKIAFLLGAGFSRNFYDNQHKRNLPLVSELKILFENKFDDIHDRCTGLDSGRSDIQDWGKLKPGEVPPSKCGVSRSLIEDLQNLYGHRFGSEPATVNIEQCIGVMYEFDNFLNQSGCSGRNFKDFTSNPIWGALIKRLREHSVPNKFKQEFIETPLFEFFPYTTLTGPDLFRDLELCDIFENVFRKQGELDVYSLNWDHGIETYYRHQRADQGILTTGFSIAPHEFKKRFRKEIAMSDVRLWDPKEFDKKAIRLHKLHGSLCWKIIQPMKIGPDFFNYVDDYSSPYDFPAIVECYGNISWLNFMDKQNLSKGGNRKFLARLAILVGLDKESHYLYEPYSTLFGLFKNGIVQAETLYVIGYGFGDYGVNNILLSTTLQRAHSESPLKLIIVSSSLKSASEIIERVPALKGLKAAKPDLVQAYSGGAHDLRKELLNKAGA